MKLVIVHESMFGNTESIAKAVADGARSRGASVVEGTPDHVTERDLDDVDLVILGAPTHGHGMPAADARAQLVTSDRKDRYPDIRDGQRSLRSWIEELTVPIRFAATFDTRFDKPAWLTGSAARWIERRLRSKDCVVASRQSFFVQHLGGPLVDGELERARSWGGALVDVAAAHREDARATSR